MKKFLLVALLACAAMSFATDDVMIICETDECDKCQSECVAKMKEAKAQGKNFNLGKCTLDCLNKK